MKNDREVAAKIRNFTPLLDELVRGFGIITAAVWGRVWRYAQQDNDVCQASVDKLAEELHLGRRTVIRHLKKLTAEGYLRDHTPDRRNRPHTYSITAKAKIMITIEGVSERHTKNAVGVPESHSGVPESHSRCARESLEETIKKQIKKQINGVDVPVSLQTPEFSAEWDDWESHRLEIRHKLTKTTVSRQLKKLSKYPVATAIAMIEQSIENGWQGLFELKETKEKRQQIPGGYSHG